VKPSIMVVELVAVELVVEAAAAVVVVEAIKISF
jgi:hypothetical protein